MAFVSDIEGSAALHLLLKVVDSFKVNNIWLCTGTLTLLNGTLANAAAFSNLSSLDLQLLNPCRKSQVKMFSWLDLRSC